MTTAIMGFFFVFLLVVYLFAGFLSHYFIIGDLSLVVKNQLFFWYKKIYHLDDIKDIKIETIYRQGTNLRVTTKDFQTKRFPACSLYNKTWRKLAARFQTFNIPVRNEAK